MEILSVNIRRKHLVGLELEPKPELENAPRDAEGFIAIDLDLCLDLDLKEGKIISEKELLEILEESEYRRAKSKAMWLVSIKEYPEKELFLKLKGEFSELASSRAIEKLKELDIINDRRYAEMYARRLIEVKKISPSVAPYLMAEKGLDKNLSKEVVMERNDDPKAIIREIVERKYLSALSTEKGKEKTIAALNRKGFYYGDIKSVLEDLIGEWINGN